MIILELIDDEKSVPFISAEAITENGINYELRGGNISIEQDKIYSQKCKPKKSDIFIVKSGSTTGRVGYVEIDLNFNIWSPLALVRSNSKNNSRFLYYFLSSDCIQRHIQNSWSFGTQPNIGMGVIDRLELAIPELEEQFAIADYLDDQTKKIDCLLDNKKVQVEKLKELRQIEINTAVTQGLNPNVKLKESGINWLGRIPKHWSTRRMKDVASVRGRIGFRGYTVDDIVDEGALVIGAKHIDSTNKLNFDEPEYISWDKYYESPEIMVEFGDVLIVHKRKCWQICVSR